MLGLLKALCPYFIMRLLYSAAEGCGVYAVCLVRPPCPSWEGLAAGCELLLGRDTCLFLKAD